MIDERAAIKEAHRKEEREYNRTLQAIEARSETTGKVCRRVLERTLKLRLQFEEKIARRTKEEVSGFLDFRHCFFLILTF